MILFGINNTSYYQNIKGYLQGKGEFKTHQVPLFFLAFVYTSEKVLEKGIFNV